MSGHDARKRSNRGDVRYARDGKVKRRAKPKKQGSPSLITHLVFSCFKHLRRSLRLIATTLLVIVGGVAVSGLLVMGYLYISKSDYFSVKKIIISGLNNTSREDVLAAAGLNHPVNILTFDLDDAERSLKALPWMNEVVVTRKMPDAVVIDIKEHIPKLLISLGRLYYLDETGVPFKELTPGETPDLPILTGLGEDDLLNPGPAMKKAIDEVFWLVEALNQRNDEFQLSNISEINYDAVRGLTLFTKNTALEVKIGFGAYEEKFRRLGRVMAHLKRNGKTEGLVYLNLEASPRVTVRYDEKYQGTALHGNGAGTLEAALSASLTSGLIRAAHV